MIKIKIEHTLSKQRRILMDVSEKIKKLHSLVGWQHNVVWDISSEEAILYITHPNYDSELELYKLLTTRFLADIEDNGFSITCPEPFFSVSAPFGDESDDYIKENFTHFWYSNEWEYAQVTVPESEITSTAFLIQCKFPDTTVTIPKINHD